MTEDQSPAGDSGEEPPNLGGDAEDLFLVLARLSATASRRRVVRDELIHRHLGLAEALAVRFSGKGVPLDDLVQVASVGLIHAVDRFDPYRGSAFAGYATAVILGELKRYFRDRTWFLRVPRRHKELLLELNVVRRDLAASGGAEPALAEVASGLGVGEGEVREALDASGAYRAVSLDLPLADEMTLAETIGESDERLDLVVDRESVRPSLTRLSERERYVLSAYFFGNQTQAQIAETLGAAQTTVSRLLDLTLVKLREEVTAG